MTASPHDALFKAIFSKPVHAAAALRSLVPSELASRIDWRSLRLVPGSFVDESLADSESDLLFEATTHAGDRVRLHLLFEHQSSVDPSMPFRVLRYMVRIWEREGLPLVPIVPVILHHSETGWTAPTSFEALVHLGTLAGTGIEAYLPRFSLLVDDISQVDDREIALRTTSAVVRLTLATLRETRRSGDAARAVRRLASLLRDVLRARGGREACVSPLRLEAYRRVLRYLLTVSPPSDPRELVEVLEREVGPAGKEASMNFLETLVEEGRREGLAKGHAEGREEALRALLRRQLEQKFGKLSARSRSRVAKLDVVGLDRALGRILSASRLGDVLTDG